MSDTVWFFWIQLYCWEKVVTHVFWIISHCLVIGFLCIFIPRSCKRLNFVAQSKMVWNLWLNLKWFFIVHWLEKTDITTNVFYTDSCHHSTFAHCKIPGIVLIQFYFLLVALGGSMVKFNPIFYGISVVGERYFLTRELPSILLKAIWFKNF